MLQAGTAKVDLVPEGELHLIGTYSRRPRLGTHYRDRLMARALALRQGPQQVVILSTDLLCISEELHLAVTAALPELGPGSVFLAATHTHSSYGGFFHSPAVEKILGAPRPEIFDFLVGRLAGLAREALADLAPARAFSGSSTVSGLVSSRRQAHGPYDDLLVLLRLERDGLRPIDLVSVSGHPVIVSEKEWNTVSGDYPGEFSRSLEIAGSDPVFLSGGLGGVSILFPEFAMKLERHLALVTGMLMEGFRRALQTLAPLEPAGDGSLRAELFHLPHGPHRCRIFSGLGTAGKALDALLLPARRRFAGTFRKAMPLEQGIPIHLVSLGGFCLVGTPHDLGVSVLQAIRQRAGMQGMPVSMVASQVNAYAGYIHLSQIYRHWPEKGYRYLALYENGLAMFGTDLGDRMVQAVEERLCWKPRRATASTRAPS